MSLARNLEHNVAQLHADVANFMAQRVEKNHCSAEWLEKYTMMRARVSDPVVEILHQRVVVCVHK